MRAPQRDENGLKKGPWSAEEDQLLIAYIKRYKIWNWSLMPKFAGLSRNGKSCRLRWVNYLNPELKRGNITLEEEDTIVSMYAELGSRWSAIAARLPGRSDNQIKNYWHTHLRKRFEGTNMPRIKPMRNEKLSFEANILNSDESYITMSPVPTTSETSTSEGSNNLPMAQSSIDGESSLLTPCSDVGINDVHDQVDDVCAGLSKVHVDLLCVQDEPFSHENLYVVKAEGTYAQEWYQEPLSPYGLYNNEYWLNILLEEDIDSSNVIS